MYSDSNNQLIWVDAFYHLFFIILKVSKVLLHGAHWSWRLSFIGTSTSIWNVAWHYKAGSLSYSPYVLVFRNSPRRTAAYRNLARKCCIFQIRAGPCKAKRNSGMVSNKKFLHNPMGIWRMGISSLEFLS